MQACGVGFLSALAFGNLNNGLANGGLSYLNGNNGLTNANWNYLARLYVKCDSQRKNFCVCIPSLRRN